MDEPATGERVSFSWELPSSSPDTQERMRQLTHVGAEVAQSESRDPFTLIMVGAIGVVALANMVVDLHRRLTHHGILINASDPRNIQIKEDPNLEYGIIIVVDATGETKQYDQRRDSVSVEALLTALTGGKAS